MEQAINRIVSMEIRNPNRRAGAPPRRRPKQPPQSPKKPKAFPGLYREAAKFLGVLIDETLSFDAHMKEFREKLPKTLPKHFNTNYVRKRKRSESRAPAPLVVGDAVTSVKAKIHARQRIPPELQHSLLVHALLGQAATHHFLARVL